MKNSPFRNFAVAALTTIGLVSSGWAAPFVDDFTNTNNITTFGSVSASASSDQLTASRTVANVDAGVDWQIGGSGRFSLNTSDAQFEFEINADTPVNGGFYSISALIYDSGGTFLEEVTLQADTNATGTFTYNVKAAATAGTAAEYFPRVRILPFNSANGAFTFNSFAAVPEPSSIVLLLTGVLLVGRRRQHSVRS